MAVNEFLAQFYKTKTAGAGQQSEQPANQETEKRAAVELFAKLAAKNNIDLSAMSQDQVGELFAQVFPEEAAKLAGDMPFPFQKKDEGKKEEGGEKPKDEGKKEEKKDDEEKKAAAAGYFADKVAFKEKFAEADLMGRVMAHAFTQELQSIKTAQAGEKVEEAKEEAKEKKEEKKEEAKEKESAAKPSPVLLQKTANQQAQQRAFEELAVKHAVEIAKQANFDSDQAASLVGAVYTLGLAESEKTAQVQDVDSAIHVRALEYLERAGYPVNWEEVFSKS
jgi:hypothetical protein